MANTILTATVTTVKLGNLEFEGLLLENGSFGIALPQLAALNLVPPNRSLKQLESLLGIVFQSHQKVKTELNPKAVNAIGIEEFTNIIVASANTGNLNAQLLRDCLVGLSLTQLFSDAFNIKFDKEERQEFLKARQEGKHQRLSLTDGIKTYMQANDIKNGSKWYGGCSQNTYLALFGMTKSALLKSRGIVDADKTTPRDYMSYEELQNLARFENHAAILMIKQGLEPFDAVKQTKEFFS